MDIGRREKRAEIGWETRDGFKPGVGGMCRAGGGWSKGNRMKDREDEERCIASRSLG